MKSWHPVDFFAGALILLVVFMLSSAVIVPIYTDTPLTLEKAAMVESAFDKIITILSLYFGAVLPGIVQKFMGKNGSDK